MSVSRYKMPLGLPADLPFDAYLTAQLEVDPLVESPVNPLNPMTLKVGARACVGRYLANVPPWCDWYRVICSGSKRL